MDSIFGGVPGHILHLFMFGHWMYKILDTLETFLNIPVSCYD